MIRFKSWWPACLLVLAGCGAPQDVKSPMDRPPVGKETPVGTPSAGAPPPVPIDSGTGVVTIGENSISIPTSWKREAPASTLRLMQYRVARLEGDIEDSELSVFHMPTGGDADTNIKRWIGQFGGDSSLKSRKTIKMANGKDAVIAETVGTFQGMAMGGPQPPPKAGFAQLGAVFDVYYIKLVGPEKTVLANREVFEKMIASFK